MEDWLLLAVLSGTCFGVGNYFVSSFSGKAESAAILVAFGLSTALFGIGYYLFRQPAQLPNMSSLAAYILVYAVIWSIGFAAQMKMFSTPGAQLSTAGVVLVTLISVATFLVGTIALGEKVTAQKLAGTALCIAGAIMLAL